MIEGKIKTILHELDSATNQISHDKIDEMISAIKSHNRIFVYGTGRSGLS